MTTKKIILGLLALAILVLVGLAGWSSLIPKEEDAQSPTRPPVTEKKKEVPTVYSYQGKVLGKKENLITIEADPAHNRSLEESTVIRVRVDGETDYKELTFPKNILESSFKPTMEKITLKDLQKGNTVNVVSSGRNVRATRAFKAQRVLLVKYQ